jgi:hypothetical protein
MKKYLPKMGHWAHFIHRDDMRAKHPHRRAYRHAGIVPPTTLPIDCIGTGLVMPMYGNDKYGNCGEAMAAHVAGILSYGQGKRQEITWPDSDSSSNPLIAQYLQVSGGDNGMDEDMEVGPSGVWSLGVGGNKLCVALDHLDIDPGDTALCNYCIDQFYTTNLAWSVPDAFINGFSPGSQWLQPMTPNPNNGHYTPLTNIDTSNNNLIITWGASCTVSQSFLASVQPSLFVIFSLLQFDPATGYDSHGRHITTQIAAWNAIGGNVSPSVANAFPPASGPTPTPVPTPVPVPTPAPAQTFSITIPSQVVNIPLGHGQVTIPGQTVTGTMSLSKKAVPFFPVSASGGDCAAAQAMSLSKKAVPFFPGGKSASSVYRATATGISFAQILAWIETYGLPLLLQVLPIIFDVIDGGLTGLTSQQIVTWVTEALAALAANQPLPPFPTPAS